MTSKTSKKTVQEEQIQETKKTVDTDVQETLDVKDEKTTNEPSFENLMTKVEATISELKTLKAEFTKYHKHVEKELAKANKGRRSSNRVRSPTGFGKPCAVPEGLRTLLGIEENKHLTRPEVTNMLYAYLDNNNLRDKDDKRIMRTNPALSKAFGLTPEQVKSINDYQKDEDGKVEKNKGLNFYNIQKYVASLYKGNPITFDIENSEDETENVKDEILVKKETKSRAKNNVNIV
jgi:chromatin remodeling complex protein RSC6